MKDGGNESASRVDSMKLSAIQQGSTIIDFILLVIFVYIAFISIFNRNVFDPLNSPLFNDTCHGKDTVDGSTSTATVLTILFVGLALGRICEWTTLPPLLGMLVAGIVLRNVSVLSSLNVPREWSSILRRTAFVIILLRGGLSLDAEQLRKMKGACLRLAILPCTGEALCVALLSHYILHIQWIFGLMLGFILAAVSPAVLVPYMIRIAEEGYGRSVSSLIIAAGSLDDVYAITLFSLSFSVAFSTGESLVWTSLKSPLEVLAGIGLGIFLGYGLRYARSSWRFPLLVSSGMASLFGCSALSFDSSGALAVLVQAFVAAPAWKNSAGEIEEEGRLRLLWEVVLQPLLFGLIGFELSFRILSIKLVLLGVLLLISSLIVRTAIAHIAVMGCGLRIGERIFVGLAWTPKATVQAALASIPLDHVERGGEPLEEHRKDATIVLAIAVLSILTTAPLGAALIRMTAPRLLKKERERREGEEGVGLKEMERGEEGRVEQGKEREVEGLIVGR